MRPKRKSSAISRFPGCSHRCALREANKPIPDDLKYLGGLTQIRFVFAYPDQKDLIISGPAEPWTEDKDKLYAFGNQRPSSHAA